MFTLLCGVVIVAALYFAREILLPFAIAVLLGFLLAPVVSRLEAWRLGRIPAVVVTVAISLLGISILGYVLATQFYELAYELPTYRSNIVAKVETFQSGGQGIVDRVLATFREVEKDITDGDAQNGRNKEPNVATADRQARGSADAQSSADEPNTLGGEKEPIPVEVVNEMTAREIAQNVLGPLFAPLGSLLLVSVFVVFILIEREDLRNRFIYLVGARNLNATTEAIDDAAYRVSRYLRMQLIINSLFGLVIALGLFLIGLPNAMLWGFLATALRFIPYVGPWIAALLPLALSLAIFPGWTQPILVALLFAVNELISNNVLEPWLYGSSTGLSTIGVIVSAVFWAWLWGPVGLIIATPLTVCLTVLGRYVPQFAFIHTLFSDEEVLSPHLRLYQRLLAMDADEATDIAEQQLQDTSFGEVCDTVLVPALQSAEIDYHQGDLESEKHRFILQAIQGMIEDFGPKPLSDFAANDETKTAILCVPAHDEADRLVGLMMAQLLAERGYDLRVTSANNLAGEAMEHVRRSEPRVVCVSALPPSATAHARYLVKRLRAQFPELRIVVALWHDDMKSKKSEERLLATGIDRIVYQLSDAVEYSIQTAASFSTKVDGDVAKPSPATTLVGAK